MTEEKPDGIQTTEDEPTKLGSCGLRETRAEGDTGREKHGQREMRAGKRKTEDGKKNGAKSDAAKTDRTAESSGKKKQACATAGPTTRPEGRHTIFISARPEYASQRRESSYRPA